MEFRKKILVIGIAFLIPLASSEDSENYLRLMDNFDQMISQLQEDNEIHKRELNDLMDRNTQMLKVLITDHLAPLNDLSSDIVSKLRGSHENQESEGSCPLQQAMLSLLRENPNNVTEELTYRLSAGSESVPEPVCPEPELEPTPSPPPIGDTCLPVPVNPEDTIELFKLRVRGKRICSNKEPIDGLNTCHGACESSTEYKFRGKRMRIVNTCSCCQPSELEKISVAMTCDNGATFSRNFDNIVACQCLKCGGPEGLANKEGRENEEDD